MVLVDVLMVLTGRGSLQIDHIVTDDKGMIDYTDAINIQVPAPPRTLCVCAERCVAPWLCCGLQLADGYLMVGGQCTTIAFGGAAEGGGLLQEVINVRRAIARRYLCG